MLFESGKSEIRAEFVGCASSDQKFLGNLWALSGCAVFLNIEEMLKSEFWCSKKH